MVFVESPWFSAWRESNLADDLFRALEETLSLHPEAGALISGGRGLRKIRVALAGRGKRGGGRVVYYHWARKDRIYLLMGYAKNVRAELSRDQIRRLARVIHEEADNG